MRVSVPIKRDGVFSRVCSLSGISFKYVYHDAVSASNMFPVLNNIS